MYWIQSIAEGSLNSNCRLAYKDVKGERLSSLHFVIFVSVLMVTGSLQTVDLLDTSGSLLCTLQDLPERRYQNSQSGLISCGGAGYSAGHSCVTFSGGNWQETHTLGTARRHHASWASPEGVLLLGGWDSGARTTTELLTDDGGSTPGFDLDYDTR